VRKAIDALVSEGILERQQGRGTFIRRAQFQSSLFRFFRFQTVSGERQVPESRILSIEPVAAPSAVAQALGLPADAPVIRIVRVRLLDVKPVLAEEIWLPASGFRRCWRSTSVAKGRCCIRSTKKCADRLLHRPKKR
jgi:GntR family transcriptional regulator